MDPVGTFSIEISDGEAFGVDSEGRLALGVNAGDPDRPELTGHASQSKPGDGQNKASTQLESNSKVNYWRIESLALQLWAEATDPILKE